MRYNRIRNNIFIQAVLIKNKYLSDRIIHNYLNENI